MVTSSVLDVSSRLIHAATRIETRPFAATIGSGAVETPPTPRPIEASPREPEVDLRTFEHTYIIPVGLFATGRSLPPVTARRGVEPPTAVRAFHGVLAGPASPTSNPKPMERRETGQAASFPRAEASAADASDDVLEDRRSLSRRPSFLRWAQEPRAAYRPPVGVGEVFDQRA